MGLYKNGKKIAGLYIETEIEHSTEQHAGIIQIATQNETADGINDSKAITPKKMKDILSDVAYSGEFDDLINRPTKVSDFENDKNFTTEQEVAQMIASIPKFQVLVVNSLPETGTTMTLYLVPKQGSEKDVHDEYIWLDTQNKYELIGSTAIDLTNYVQKEELTQGLNTKQDKLISGTNIKTLNNESILGNGNIDINSAEWGNISGTLSSQTDLQNALNSKQNTLKAGPNITIDPNTNTISASGGLAEVSWGGITGSLSNQTDLQNILDSKQPTGDYALNSTLNTHTNDYTIHVTQQDKNNWSGKQDKINNLSTIESNAQAGKNASDTISGYGNIVTHNANEFQVAGDYATNTRVNEVEATANNAKSIAEGKATGYVFDTKEVMDSWIQEHSSELKLGDNLYIRAIDVPDYWWDGSSAQELETQKVDLTDYVTDTQLTQGLGTKQDTINDLDTIRSNATSGKNASDTISGYGNIVTHNTSEFQLAGDYATKEELDTKADKNIFAGVNDFTETMTAKAKVTSFSNLGTNAFGSDSTYQTTTINSGSTHWSSSTSSGMKIYMALDKPRKVNAINIVIDNLNTYGYPKINIYAGNDVTQATTNLIFNTTVKERTTSCDLGEVEYQYFLIHLIHNNWINCPYVYLTSQNDGLLRASDLAILKNKQDAIADIATIRTQASSAYTNINTHKADTTIHVTSSDKETWNNKQDALISGTNIKTLNNESLLGEGNIDITSAQWGNITGTLSNQTDLQNALDGKSNGMILRIWE